MGSWTDARSYCSQDMRAAVSVTLAARSIQVFSARCPGKDENEDSAAVLPFGKSDCVLVVADGVGGHSRGAEASRIVVETLAETVARAAKDGVPMRVAILDGIEEANTSVTALGVGAATTVAVAGIEGDSVRSYHVGDSMVLLVGQRGKQKLRTISHSPTGYAVEAGVLDPDEALMHEDRHFVSNIVGSEQMRIDVGPSVPFAPRDTLLLASDGLMDNLALDEIVASIRKGALEVAAEVLATTARARMLGGEEGAPSKPDDLTFALMRGRGRRAAVDERG